MGHALGDQADAAVKKSKKKEEAKNRSEAEIIRDIELNLNAGLSVVPLDIRLLLNRYKEFRAQLDSMTNEGGPDGGNDSSRSGEKSSGEEERSREGSVAASESGE